MRYGKVSLSWELRWQARRIREDYDLSKPENADKLAEHQDLLRQAVVAEEHEQEQYYIDRAQAAFDRGDEQRALDYMTQMRIHNATRTHAYDGGRTQPVKAITDDDLRRLGEVER